MSIRYSANLGFLWTDRPLPDAIRAAAAAGFDAVECHFPDLAEADAIRAALDETGLPMVSLNTKPGDREAGEFGLAALPHRVSEAKAAIDTAVTLAARLDARWVHVMAGRTPETAEARRVFVAALRRAADLAGQKGIGVLIEPINRRDVPGYFLARTNDAAAIIAEADRPNLRMMLDCYHVAIGEGDPLPRLDALLPLIGHVQIAGVPDRAEPDTGDIDYLALLGTLARLGYGGLVGAEYHPRTTPEQGLGWLKTARSLASEATRG